VVDRLPLGSGAPGTRPPRIFVNYRREDAAPYAGRLYDTLTERFGEANVFMDVDTIALGTDFTEAIERALASCDAVVTLIGRSWLDATDADGRRRLDDPRDVLRLELEHALGRPLLVVPATVQGASLPREEELPPTLAPLARRQSIELRDEAWRDDLARLVRRLEQAVPRLAQPKPTARRRAVPAWRRPRAAVAAAVIVIVAAALVGVALATGDGAGDGNGDGVAATTEQRLRLAIPAVVRPSCATIDWGPASAVARVSCQGAEVVSVDYYLFDSAAVLEGWYAIARENAGVRTDGGACTASDFSGEGGYEVDGAMAGRRFCYFDGAEATMVWTDDDARVGARANVWQGTGAAAAETLLTQWRCCLAPQR
jgi:TIR domain